MPWNSLPSIQCTGTSYHQFNALELLTIDSMHWNSLPSIQCTGTPYHQFNALELFTIDSTHWNSLPSIQCRCINSAKIFGDAIQAQGLDCSYLYFSDGKFPTCLFVIRVGIFRSCCGLRGTDTINQLHRLAG
jgi:hypothetical protein